MELSSQSREGRSPSWSIRVSEVRLVKISLHRSSGAVGIGAIKPLGKQVLCKRHSTEFSRRAVDQEMQALLCYRPVLPHFLDL